MENITSMIRFTKREIIESNYLLNTFEWNYSEVRFLLEKISILTSKLSQLENERNLIKLELELGNIWN